MSIRQLHALTYLAPNMFPVYQFIMAHLSKQLGCEIILIASENYDDVLEADLAFICGLPYVLYTPPHIVPAPIEAIIAPILQGERFQNRPIYFSDVIVHRDSQFHSLTDLRGCSWAYNEPFSQSGYGITRYQLVEMGETDGFFGKVVEAGFHEKSIEMVCNRDIDASAIDVQVLAVECRNNPHLADQLRIIDTLGPSTIQPLVAARHLPHSLKQDIQAICADLHLDPAAPDLLDMGFIDRLVPVTDADYNDIRHMHNACQQANFMTLK